MTEDVSATLVHWFVVTLNGFFVGLMAALVFTLGVVLWGAGYEFLRIWRDRTYRPRGFWMFSWATSLVATLADGCLRAVASVPVGELRVLDGDQWKPDARDVMVIVHGTFGALTRHKWQRWKKIASTFPATQWQVLRYGWAGGNSRAARQRAAERLAQLLGQVRTASGTSRRVVLVGHSHGGSVAYEAARVADVDVVVAIATPFVGAWTQLSESLRKDLNRGMAMRYFAPVGLLVVAGMMMIGPDAKASHQYLFVALAAIPVAAIFVFQVWFGGREHNLLKEFKNHVKTPVLVIHGTGDSLMKAAVELESSTRNIAQVLRRTGTLARRVIARASLSDQAPSIWKFSDWFAHYVASAFPWFSWRWLKEAVLFACVGMVLIDSLAALFPFFPEVARAGLAAWIFPSTNYLLAKTIIYAALFTPFFLLCIRVVAKTWLPSWHRSTFLVGRHWAASARLSQLYSFKAGLSGFGGMTLHFGDAAILNRPDDCDNLRVEPIEIPEGLAAHSDILDSPECAELVARIASTMQPAS